jgi:anti-sigma-K factor RskA
MSDSPDHDLLAAEYVLGTLEGDEAAEAARLLTADAAFAAAVRAWEERLAPLSAVAPPVAPLPGLWERIEATTAPSAAATPAPSVTAAVISPAFRRRLRIWQVSTGAALAIAASLAAFVVLRPLPPPRVAVLVPVTGGAPVLLATAEQNGTLIVRPDGTIIVPGDRDLELWALAAGETRPRSLGVLPAAGRQLVASLAPGTRLLVSLEPRGGSPTGQPTGPVLYSGRLAAVD